MALVYSTSGLKIVVGPNDDKLDVSSTALLVCDLQYVVTQAVLPSDEVRNAFLMRCAKVIAHSRELGLEVVHVVLRSPDIPDAEVSSSLKTVSTFSKLNGPNSKYNIHAEMDPHPDDLVVIKHRVSAFFGTDLQVYLKAHEIQHLVILGLATTGVVLSTVRCYTLRRIGVLLKLHWRITVPDAVACPIVCFLRRYAADADYKIFVVEDCCTGMTEEAHRVLMSEVFPMQARVLSSGQFISELRLASPEIGPSRAIGDFPVLGP